VENHPVFPIHLNGFQVPDSTTDADSKPIGVGIGVERETKKPTLILDIVSPLIQEIL
jgi:hypothetical protein